MRTNHSTKNGTRTRWKNSVKRFVRASPWQCCDTRADAWDSLPRSVGPASATVQAVKYKNTFLFKHPLADPAPVCWEILLQPAEVSGCSVGNGVLITPLKRKIHTEQIFHRCLGRTWRFQVTWRAAGCLPSTPWPLCSCPGCLSSASSSWASPALQSAADAVRVIKCHFQFSLTRMS